MNRRNFFRSIFTFASAIIFHPTVSKFVPAPVKKIFTPADIEGLTCWYMAKDDMLLKYNRALKEWEIAEVENYLRKKGLFDV